MWFIGTEAGRFVHHRHTPNAQCDIFSGAMIACQNIGTNVDGITANINYLTKPHWYNCLLGYGLNGVVISPAPLLRRTTEEPFDVGQRCRQVVLVASLESVFPSAISCFGKFRDPVVLRYRFWLIRY